MTEKPEVIEKLKAVAAVARDFDDYLWEDVLPDDLHENYRNALLDSAKRLNVSIQELDREINAHS